MKILAFEFSSPQRGVAVVEAGADGTARWFGEAIEAGTPSAGPLRLVEEALNMAQVEREQIQCVAVGLGPGSYTGIRAAIALAQGWQLARGVKLLGLSSVECLAAQAQEENLFGRVTVVIDAQRSQIYLATYEINATERREVERLRLASVPEAQARAQNGEPIIGPEIDRLLGVGRVLAPGAIMLGRLAAGREDFTAGEMLEPIYLREASFVKATPPRVLPAERGEPPGKKS